MPAAEVSCCQCSALAVAHTCAPLAQSCLRCLLVWHTASKMRAFPGVCAPQPERCWLLHLGVNEALLLPRAYIGHAEHKSGTPKVESAPADSACRVDRGSGANLG